MLISLWLIELKKKICLLEFGWVRFHCLIPRETKATETKGLSPNWILFALWSCRTSWKTSTKVIRIFHGSVVREGFWKRSIIDSEGEGGVSFTSYQSWHKDVMAAALDIQCTPLLLSYSKITKDVSASRPSNSKTSIASTRKQSALNRSMVDYGNFFTLCWHSCFCSSIRYPHKLAVFWKKRKAKFNTKVFSVDFGSLFFLS